MKIIKLLILLLVACSLSAKAGVVKISGSLKQFGLDRVSMNSDGIAAEVYHDRTIEIILDSNGRFDLKLKLKQPVFFSVVFIQMETLLGVGRLFESSFTYNQEKLVFQLVRQFYSTQLQATAPSGYFIFFTSVHDFPKFFHFFFIITI